MVDGRPLNATSIAMTSSVWIVGISKCAVGNEISKRGVADVPPTLNVKANELVTILLAFALVAASNSEPESPAVPKSTYAVKFPETDLLPVIWPIGWLTIPRVSGVR